MPIRAPKKTDIARQFEVRNVRPFTYTAYELKNGDIVLKKVPRMTLTPSPCEAGRGSGRGASGCKP